MENVFKAFKTPLHFLRNDLPISLKVQLVFKSDTWSAYCHKNCVDEKELEMFNNSPNNVTHRAEKKKKIPSKNKCLICVCKGRRKYIRKLTRENSHIVKRKYD